MRVLIVEDDITVSEYIAKGLREATHSVETATDGKDGLFLATTETFDVVILDRMLPGVDGMTVLRTLRASANAVPVLVLSALGDVDARVEGLKAGSDDYLAKPFAFSELLARVEGLARRRVGAAPELEFRVGDLSVDLLSRQVMRAGKSIELQPREFSLLEMLIRHVDQVVTRTMLLEQVWGYHFDPQTNVIDVHISRLRNKLDKGFAAPLLHTVRGAGYVLRTPAASE